MTPRPPSGRSARSSPGPGRSRIFRTGDRRMPVKAQGQVWWANLPDPLGWRPVLILTRTDALPRLLYATVAPLSRTIRGIDSEVVLEPDDGVPTRSAVTLDN